MLTIWGRADSSAVARVMWAVAETGQPHRRIDWGGRHGGNDAPEHRARSPGGRVPAIEAENGFTLFESNVIVRWLAARSPETGLMPEDPSEAWLAQAWMDWSEAPARTVGAVRTAYRREKPEAAEIGRAVEAAAEALQVLDRRLAERGYIMGDRLTIADLALGVIVHRWFRVPEAIARPPLPDLARWYAALCDRPAFREHVVARVSVRPQFVGMGT